MLYFPNACVGPFANDQKQAAAEAQNTHNHLPLIFRNQNPNTQTDTDSKPALNDDNADIVLYSTYIYMYTLYCQTTATTWFRVERFEKQSLFRVINRWFKANILMFCISRDSLHAHLQIISPLIRPFNHLYTLTRSITFSSRSHSTARLFPARTAVQSAPEWRPVPATHVQHQQGHGRQLRRLDHLAPVAQQHQR